MPNLHQHGVLRMQADGTKGTTVAVSHNPDFTSLHEVGEKVYMLTHFEAPYPGGWVDGWVGRLVGACTQGWAGERAPAGPRSTPSPHAHTCTPPPPPPGGMYLTELDAAKAAQGVLTPLSFKVSSPAWCAAVSGRAAGCGS